MKLTFLRPVVASCAMAVFGATAFAQTQTQTQASASAARKVAVVSLIGDTMSIDVYKPRTDTSFDTNARDVVKLPTQELDLAALRAVKLAAEKAWPGAEVVTLAVPAAGSTADPAMLLAEGRLADPRTNGVADALQREGFTHLVAVSKHRAPARFKIVTGTVGSGALQGLGFYIDRQFELENAKTGEGTAGYLAPYAYFKLSLVDVASRALLREEPVTASVIKLGTDSGSGLHPWNAMSGQQKTSALQSLIETNVTQRTTTLLGRP